MTPDPLYFAGAGVAGAGVVAGFSTGAAGLAEEVAGLAGAAGAAGALAGRPLRPPNTEPGPRWPRIPRASAPKMNSTNPIVVALESTVAPVRAPNAAWLLPPPKALAMSPP